MLTRLGIFVAIAIAINGCATTKPTKSAYQTYVDTYTAAASAPPKILDIECPTTGCNFTKLVVYNPSGALSGGLQPPAPEPNVGLEIFREVKSTILGAMPWYAGMRVLEKSYEVANHGTTTVTNTDNSNRSTSSTTSSSTANTTTTSTSTTTNTSNSNNVSHSCSTGSSSGGGTGAGGTTGGTNC